MRRLSLLVLAVAAVGCKRIEPADEVFADDVKIFCSAWQRYGRPRSFAELTPRFAEQLRSQEFIDLFKNMKAEDTTAMLDRVDAAVRRAQVKSCPTLDWLRSPR